MLEQNEFEHSLASQSGLFGNALALLRVPNVVRNAFLYLTFFFYLVVDYFYMSFVKWTTRSVSLKDRQLRDLQQRIAGAVCLQLHLPSIDWDTPLYEFGLTSVHAVALSAQLETFLGRKVDPSIFAEHQTVSQLAQYLLNPPKETKPSTSYKVEPKPHPLEPTSSREGTFIFGLGTAFPEHNFSQDEIFDTLLEKSSKLRKSAVVGKVRNLFHSAAVKVQVNQSKLTLVSSNGSAS